MAVSVIEDVTEAKEAELRQRFLAQAGATLTSSLDYEETLQRVAQLVVPGLADWCAVDVLDANQRLKLVAVAHVDPDKVAFARELRNATRPTPTRTPGSTACCAPGVPSSTPRCPTSCSSRHRGSGAARDDPRAGHALGHAHPDGRRRAHDRRDDDGVGRERARLRRGRPRLRGRPGAPGGDGGRERAAVHRARAAAETLQESLLPERLPTMPGWELARRTRRATRRSTSAATSSTSSSSTRASWPSSATSPARACRRPP